MLIGPNAPLSLVPNIRGTYMTHAYDFYKPDFSVEYPIVNGHESIRCYISALDGCYKNLQERLQQKHDKANGTTNGVESDYETGRVMDLFDYMAFHTPNCKLVSKSYGRLLYNDCLMSTDEAAWEGIPEELRNLEYQESLTNKILEKTVVSLTKEAFQTRVEPSILAPSKCGNMYTASLYCSLLSLLSNIDAQDARGKLIGMFSVSGLFVGDQNNALIRHYSTEAASPALFSVSRLPVTSRKLCRKSI